MAIEVNFTAELLNFIAYWKNIIKVIKEQEK